MIFSIRTLYTHTHTLCITIYDNCRAIGCPPGVPPHGMPHDMGENPLKKFDAWKQFPRQSKPKIQNTQRNYGPTSIEWEGNNMDKVNAKLKIHQWIPMTSNEICFSSLGSTWYGLWVLLVNAAGRIQLLLQPLSWVHLIRGAVKCHHEDTEWTFWWHHLQQLSKGNVVCNWTITIELIQVWQVRSCCLPSKTQKYPIVWGVSIFSTTEKNIRDKFRWEKIRGWSGIPFRYGAKFWAREPQIFVTCTMNHPFFWGYTKNH